MKQSSRYEDTDFQALNRKISLNEKDRHDVLERIHEKIDVAPTTRKSSPPRKYYFAMAAAAVVFMLVLVPSLLSNFNKPNLSEGGTITDQHSSQAELEEILSSYGYAEILHQEEVENGVVVLFTDYIKKDVNIIELNAVFVRKTEDGWDKSLDGGSHTFLEQTELSYQLLLASSDQSPFPLLFGSIIDPAITQVQVTNLDNKQEYTAEIITSENGKSYWYAFVDANSLDAYEIQGVGENGMPIQSSLTHNESALDFELTEEEGKVYELLKADLDVKHAKDLPPISIAKLYVQASLDKEWEVKYELYTDREDRHQISKEEYFNEMTNQTKEQIENSFFGIQDGTFRESEDGSGGHISFMNISGEVWGFSMVKEEDGSWSVSFIPLQ